MSRNDANLSCFLCGSEFECVAGQSNGTLYKCHDCGTELTKKEVRKVASLDDGPMAQLAEQLLRRAGEMA